MIGISTNVITPNGDGLNDYLIIDNLPRNAKFTVFTRDSKIVFQSDNYQNNWNGTDQQSLPLENGTYWYALKTLGEKKYSGYIVISR